MVSVAHMVLSESKTLLVMFWFLVSFFNHVLFFLFNFSTMELSKTLFVIALLLSGKNLWLCKVLESFTVS